MPRGRRSPGCHPTPLWAARCKRRRAKHDSGPPNASAIRHVVVHATEGGTAASVAAFFATTARASTQLVVDDLECYRCVPDLVIPWGAPGVNTSGLHVENCGFARWTRETWLEHDAMLLRSAAKAALWCWTFGIPRRWLTVTQLREGRRDSAGTRTPRARSRHATRIPIPAPGSRATCGI